MAINLQQFCEGPDGVREYLATPFRHGNVVAATNGHILVWIPDDGRECPDINQKLLKGLPLIMAPVQGEYIPASSITLPPEEDCSRCHGYMVRECDMGHEHDCDTCDGTGKAVQRVSVQGVDFQRTYLAQIASLPDAEFCVNAKPDSVAAFRFTGGEGRLMPMRRKP